MNGETTNEERFTTNIVRLTGEICSAPALTHEICGEGFYEFFVSVPRLSGKRDVIPVTAAERLLCGATLREGDKVSIEGQFRSYNRLSDGRSKLMLTVFVKEFTDPTCASSEPNSVELTGYVCKDPVYRTTPLSREICDVLLAVNRAFGKSDYIPCIAWGRNARYCKMLPVGTKLRVAGRIQSRQYVKTVSEDESETRSADEIAVGRIERLRVDRQISDCAATVRDEEA